MDQKSWVWNYEGKHSIDSTRSRDQSNQSWESNRFREVESILDNWFSPEIWINLDIQINTPFESSLPTDQLLTLHWHNKRKSLPGHDQRKFIIKTSELLDLTKMLVESNLGSRINPRTRPDQDVSRVKSWESDQSLESNQSGRAIKSDSRINLESRINCLIRINSWIWPTFKISSKRSADRRISRQRYNFYVAYSFYVDPNLQPSGEIILRQQARST